MIGRLSRRGGAGFGALLAAVLLMSHGAPARAQVARSAIVRVRAEGSVPEVVSRLKKMVGQNGMMVMGSLDQGKVLSMTGLHIQSETLFVGNPQVGKKLFSANPAVGLVVPIRVNVYEDADGHTVVSYLAPSALLTDFGNPAIDSVAQMLDSKLHQMVQMLGS